MSLALVTGASGFFGGVLKRKLLNEGHFVVNIDLEPDEDHHPCLHSIQGDLRDLTLLRSTFAEHRFDVVYHCAAQLAHGKLDEHLLWSSNVDAPQLLCQTAADAQVRPFLFLSSNCLWASNLGHTVHELHDLPAPIELYGRSKLEGERIVQSFAPQLDAVILRCPTIMDRGRLGLLAILYEFIDDGRTVWVVGDGSNRYQFIYAEDLAQACVLASKLGRSDLFHIGSDNVGTMRETYESVIRHAAPTRASRCRSRVRSLPEAPTLFLMKLAHTLKLSPLGPYHYKIIDLCHSNAHPSTWKPKPKHRICLQRPHERCTPSLDGAQLHPSAGLSGSFLQRTSLSLHECFPIMSAGLTKYRHGT